MLSRPHVLLMYFCTICGGSFCMLHVVIWPRSGTLCQHVKDSLDFKSSSLTCVKSYKTVTSDKHNAAKEFACLTHVGRIVCIAQSLLETVSELMHPHPLHYDRKVLTVLHGGLRPRWRQTSIA